MHRALPTASLPASPRTGHRRRLKRQAATFAARCAMGSWLLLAAMPVVVVVCALN